MGNYYSIDECASEKIDNDFVEMPETPREIILGLIREKVQQMQTTSDPLITSKTPGEIIIKYPDGWFFLTKREGMLRVNFCRNARSCVWFIDDDRLDIPVLEAILGK